MKHIVDSREFPCRTALPSPSLAPPTDQPTLLLPTIPWIQGQSGNVTCLSSPSKPASTLALYKNEQRIVAESSLTMSYELDTTTKRNRTKLTYTIRNPDSSWNNVSLRCEQTYAFDKYYQRDVRKNVQVRCKSVERCLTRSLIACAHRRLS